MNIFHRRREGNKPDSVATFWNVDIFDKIDSWTLYFETGSKCEIFSKPQVATFVALKILNPENHYYGKENEQKGHILLVWNTHLLFNNSRGDIKLSQLDLIIKSAAYLKEKLNNDYEDQIVNIIFWGDFNSIPNSGIYNYMIDGVYDCLTMKKNEISGQKIAFVNKEYSHEYTDGDTELEETIDTKHEKFIKVNRRLKKLDSVAGNNTPHWVAKLQSAKINGIGEDNIIEFSFLEDTKETIEKYRKLDVALKKLYHSAITDKDDK